MNNNIGVINNIAVRWHSILLVVITISLTKVLSIIIINVEIIDVEIKIASLLW